MEKCYGSAVSQIDSIVTRLLELHPKRIDLTLERMWRILAALGHPEQRLPPVIHVAGTNGKGSSASVSVLPGPAGWRAMPSSARP
jgi:folylpolyglutamate synthase/dihydropteroate synthase